VWCCCALRLSRVAAQQLLSSTGVSDDHHTSKSITDHHHHQHHHHQQQQPSVADSTMLDSGIPSSQSTAGLSVCLSVCLVDVSSVGVTKYCSGLRPPDQCTKDCPNRWSSRATAMISLLPPPEQLSKHWSQDGMVGREAALVSNCTADCLR